MNTNAFHISRTIAIVVASGIVLLGAVGYLYMEQKKGSDEIITTSGGPTSESEATFVTLAGQLDTIAFDTNIFTDPRFTSLQDIHTAITPEPLGRTDPFAR